MGLSARLSQTAAVKMKTGICLYRLSRFPEALGVFSGIDSPKALYWKGKTLMSMEREKEAIGTFELLYKLNPQSSWTRKSLLKAARLRHLGGESEEARRLYSLIIEKYPRRKEASKSAWNLGWLHYRNKEYEKALEIFSNRAWANWGERQRFLYWYARAAEKTGDKPGALFALGKLLDSPKITYYSTLAKLRLKKNLLLPARPATAHAENPFGKNPTLEKFLFFAKVRDIQPCSPGSRTAPAPGENGRAAAISRLALPAGTRLQKLHNHGKRHQVPRGASFLFSEGL